MIPMKAPPHVLSLSVGGVQFQVENGVVQVPPPYVKHALAHKFQLLDAQNADALIEADLEAALAKAQRSIPLRGMKGKPGMTKMNIEGITYDVGKDGYVEVPENVAHVAMLLGCTEGTLRPKETGSEDDGPRDNAGLRTDGPTLEEYLAAGYAAAGYPPRGYSDKRTAEELEAAGNAASGSEVPALPTLEALKAMPDPELRAFLHSVGVEFLGDAKRKDMTKAATEWLAKAQEDAAKEAETKKD